MIPKYLRKLARKLPKRRLIVNLSFFFVPIGLVWFGLFPWERLRLTMSLAIYEQLTAIYYRPSQPEIGGPVVGVWVGIAFEACNQSGIEWVKICDPTHTAHQNFEDKPRQLSIVPFRKKFKVNFPKNHVLVAASIMPKGAVIVNKKEVEKRLGTETVGLEIEVEFPDWVNLTVFARKPQLKPKNISPKPPKEKKNDKTKPKTKTAKPKTKKDREKVPVRAKNKPPKRKANQSSRNRTIKAKDFVG